MFVSWWKWKTRKIIIPSPIPSYELLVSVKENTDRREKNKKERTKYGQNKKQETLLTLCIMLKYNPNN